MDGEKLIIIAVIVVLSLAIRYILLFFVDRKSRLLSKVLKTKRFSDLLHIFDTNYKKDDKKQNLRIISKMKDFNQAKRLVIGLLIRE